MNVKRWEGRCEPDSGDSSAVAGEDRIGVHLTKQLSRYGEAMTDSSIETVLLEQVNTAPEPLRSYIHELERQADPASNLRELIYAREEKKMLGVAIFELEEAIRQHRDTQGPGRCRTSDRALYDVVDEPSDDSIHGGDSCPS